jgi:hypothetical protein
MIMLQRPSFGAPVAIAYITLGALIGVWSGIWYFYLHNNPPQENTAYYFCTGFLLTGLVLIVIGLALGPIGRVARQAEHHPELLPDEANLVVPPAPIPPTQLPVGYGNGASQGIPTQGNSSLGPVQVSAGEVTRPDQG